MSKLTRERKEQYRASGLHLRRRESLASRFWRKVDFTGDCWIWQGTRTTHEYGVIGVNYRIEKAHRVAYALAKGPIPDGLDILHSCDNPPCVRPDHLRPGTPLENAHDRVTRGRHFTPFRDPAVRQKAIAARVARRMGS